MTIRRLRPVLLAGLVLAVPSLGQAQRYDPRQVDPRGGGQGDPYRERVEVRLNALESELRDITGRVEETERKSTRLNSRHSCAPRMPSSPAKHKTQHTYSHN